jgi:uncharacterized protein (DUF924 family)
MARLGVASSEEVLKFWFGAVSPDDPPGPDKFRFWFQGGEEVDRQIRERFGEDVERAGRGELNGWAETPRGRLALIILLDQFSRNLHRGSAEAFANDPASLKLTLEGLASRQDEALSCVEQLFFVLPLEHAEDLAMQDRMLAYLDTWAKRVPAAMKGMTQGVRDFAQQHREVIARFGRFPTRNQALGRISTPEEEAHVREAKAAARPV